MIKRNGSTFRTLLIAVVMVALIYFIYLYNGVQSRLRNSEVMSEKLKRDRESLSSQLNDISLEKERVKEKYQKERLEIMSKLSDVQNKYKMLQSQHQDMETEYSRIQQKLDKFTEDSRLKEANRNQEFMQLKQEKEMEVVKLKDQNANLFRENEQYKSETIQLKQQLQQQQLSVQREQSESESLRQQLQLAKAINMKNLMNNQMDTGGSLRAGNIQLGQQPVQQQPVQQQQPIIQAQPVLQQQQQFLQQPQQQGLLNDLQNGNALGRILHQPPNNQFGQQAQMAQGGNLEGVNHGLPVKRDAPVEQHNFQIQPADAPGNIKDNNGKDLALQKQEVEHRKQQSENEHNQVQPPMNNEQLEPVIFNQPQQEQQQLLQPQEQQLQEEEEEEEEKENKQLLQDKQLLNNLRNGNSLARILHGLKDNQFHLQKQQPRRKSPNKTGADKPANPMEAPNAKNPPVANDQQQNVLIAPAANEKVNGLMSQDDRKDILMAPNKDDVAKQVLPVNNGNANDVGIDFPAVDNNGNMRVQL